MDGEDDQEQEIPHVNSFQHQRQVYEGRLSFLHKELTELYENLDAKFIEFRRQLEVNQQLWNDGLHDGKCSETGK
jgi:hypothetical protein